jgi:hypothetical protein
MRLLTRYMRQPFMSRACELSPKSRYIKQMHVSPDDVCQCIAPIYICHPCFHQSPTPIPTRVSSKFPLISFHTQNTKCPTHPSYAIVVHTNKIIPSHAMLTHRNRQRHPHASHHPPRVPVIRRQHQRRNLQEVVIPFKLHPESANLAEPQLPIKVEAHRAGKNGRVEAQSSTLFNAPCREGAPGAASLIVGMA